MKEGNISKLPCLLPSADSANAQEANGATMANVIESEKVAGKEMSFTDTIGSLGIENVKIDTSVPSREERKREILIKARQARIDWILGSVEKDAEDLKEVLSGKQNPLRNLLACTPDRVSCAPAVVEAMFYSNSKGFFRNRKVIASKITSEVKRILESEHLSWESVCSSSLSVFPSPCEEYVPEIHGSTAQSQHEQDGFLTMPPVPQAQSYKTFLQILCEPEAADIVMSIQKFCKTIEEASRVMLSVQEAEKNKEMNAKSERAKKLLQQHQLPIVSSSNPKDGDPDGMKDKTGDGVCVEFLVSAGGEEGQKFVQESTFQANNKHATSLAKALRGFINKTFRDMQSHSSFKVFLESCENRPEEIKIDLKDEFMGCLEAFVFTKCHKPIYRVLRGALEEIDDDHDHNILPCVSKEQTYRSAKTVDEVEFELTEKMKLLQFVTPEHLEIHCLKLGSNSCGHADDLVDLSYSMDQLRSIAHQPSPRQKLRSILLAYRGINASLNAVLERTKRGTLSTSPPSADDVLPTLILAVLRAQPSNILTDLRLIEFFATTSLLRGEAGYAYTNLCGAVQFLRKIDLDGHAAEVSLGGLGECAVLSIFPDDFRAGIEKTRKAMALADDIIPPGTEKSNEEKQGPIESDEGERNAMGTALNEMLLPMKISGRDIREARTSGETIDLNWALRKQTDLFWQEGKVHTTMSESLDASVGNKRLPPDEPPIPQQFTRSYSYLTTRVDDIRISDLPCLLDEYKVLVRATESLLNERSAWVEAEKSRQTKIIRYYLERNYHEVIGEAGADLVNGQNKGDN